ncbi:MULTISPECIES: hypothetical protein [Novosphingobium]|uniref:hypothetical protein n=1 Tax=Novosphingobium TaxID=165696 RepID=UPI00082FD7B9|nr:MULTISPECIES: hypothetical protein [Novosphingobium]
MISTLLAGALASPLAAKPAPPVQNVSPGVQVGVGDCVSQANPSRGIAGAVLPLLVSKGVNLIGRALSEAGQDKTWKAMGSRNLDGAVPQCIQIVRGRFQTNTPPASAPAGFESLSLPATAFDKLKSNGIWLADKPDFFFEGALVISNGGTAATVRPLQTVMFTPQGERAFRGQTRSVVLLFAFSGAGENPNLDSNPAATITLGEMQPGQVLKFASDANGQATSYEAPWFTLSEDDVKKPLTITALLSESQPGSPFFAFLASIFNDDAVKKEITEQANLVFVPGAQTAANAVKQQADLSALGVAEEKFGSALAALVACSKAGSDAVAEGVTAKAALRAYAAADAALPTPSKKVDETKIAQISLLAPSGIANNCQAVYRQLTGEDVP